MINKIVELIINLEEFEFDDLGVEIMSLVDRPAIEVGWMAFNEDEVEFRKNPDCPDGWEHHMPDGSWMCGKTMGYEKCPEGQDCYDLDEACWPGYEAIGTKMKNGREVPNCVPVQNSKFESFTDYPEAARNNAQRAIDYKEENGSDCGTKVGWTRARQLADGKPISEETIARMASFARHEQHKDVPYSEGCGGIMWDAWGGSAGVNWAQSKLDSIREEMSFSKEEEYQKGILKLAEELGTQIDPEQVIYVDGTKENFATVGDFLQGARAIAALGDIPRDTPARLMYRYAGPSGQRFFCKALKGLNKIYTREDITRMNRLNPNFAHSGGVYSIFEYKGGPNCQHYWEELVQFQDGTRNVLISNGPATGDAGKTNNRRDPSPDGAVANNAYYMSKNWSFSDDDQMIITGPAMIPNALIARKDEMGNLFHVYFSKETVEKVARKFLADNNAHVTDINHDDNIVEENTLLESWIVEDPKMDKSTAMGFNVPKSTWMVSYKINNKETWNKIKAGELNGFSVAGSFLEKIQSNG